MKLEAKMNRVAESYISATYRCKHQLQASLSLSQATRLQARVAVPYNTGSGMEVQAW